MYGRHTAINFISSISIRMFIFRLLLIGIDFHKVLNMNMNMKMKVQYWFVFSFSVFWVCEWCALHVEYVGSSNVFKRRQSFVQFSSSQSIKSFWFKCSSFLFKTFFCLQAIYVHFTLDALQSKHQAKHTFCNCFRNSIESRVKPILLVLLLMWNWHCGLMEMYSLSSRI